MFGTALSQVGFGTATRGNGEKGRSPPSEYQEKYLYALNGRIVIAGRCGIVKELRHHFAMVTPQQGTLLIAQLDFAIGINDSSHMRVAGIAVDSAVAESHPGQSFWKNTVEELHAKTVRVLAFKDSAECFQEALRKKMQNTQISNVCGRGPSFFVLGPVQSVGDRHKKMWTYRPDDGMDSSMKWPSIGMVKLKLSHTEIEQTKSTFVFIGSLTPRRSSQSMIHRKRRRV